MLMGLLNFMLLDERRRRGGTHVDGNFRNKQQPATTPQQSNWGRINDLANKFENGSRGANGAGGGGGGGGGAGGAGGAGGGGGGGGGGFMPLAGLDDAPTTPGDVGIDNVNAQLADGKVHVWTEFKMFDDEERMRQQDIAEMLQRLREEALKDSQKAESFLKAHPDLTRALMQALPSSDALQGWAAPGAKSAAMSPGATGPGSSGACSAAGGGGGGGGGGGA